MIFLFAGEFLTMPQPRTFVPRALLYNDGGFDVSPDGKTLCVCAEYWLPDGVDDAMVLLRREELAHEADARRRESVASNMEISTDNVSPDTAFSALHSTASSASALRT